MRTVLFADDNAMIREFCQKELEEEGYRVIAARDGLEAAELAGRLALDVVVLDLSMPRCGGMEAAEKIRAVDGNVPLVFFTAHDEDCLVDPRSRLAAACVEKSEDLTELKRVLARLFSPHPLRTGLPPLEAAPPPRSRPSHEPANCPQGKELNQCWFSPER
ncbi:MAG: response regulator [Thermoguttaceae bacterium]|jgi:CheY-like chemotaxis protein|nr:response regulator [Thermoguttaceae bacterium]